MPHEVPSRSSETTCRICGELTNLLHLGVGCRACAVFYRRANSTGAEYYCKAGDGKCSTKRDAPGAPCKRCRYQKFAWALEQTQRATRAKTPRPMMERLRKGYETMCAMRTANERSLQDGEQVVENIFAGECKPVLVRESRRTQPLVTKFFYAAFVEFVHFVFEEFSSFNEDEKKRILQNSNQSIYGIDSHFRTIANFPDDNEKFMNGMTTYFSRVADPSQFYPGGMQSGKVSDVMQLYGQIQKYAGQTRRLMEASDNNDDANLTKEEQIAVMGLELWDSNQTEFSEQVLDAFERNKQQLLRELHAYYREEQCCEDYASRIGELMILRMSLKRILGQFDETAELFNLYGFNEEDHMILQMRRMNLS